MYIQGCHISDLSLVSDFLRIKETGTKLTKYGQNMGKSSIVPIDMLKRYGNDILSGPWQGFENSSLNAVSVYQNQCQEAIRQER